MFSIENKIIDERIPYIKFSCNLEACKGACCTVKGGKGAPLADFEIFEIQNCLSEVSKYLSERSLEIIKENSGIEGYSGNYTTSCIDDEDCVFVYYEDDIAKCAFEKAFQDGKIEFRKPISCHLFPIRISNFGGDVIRYEKFIECKPALIKGQTDNVPLHIFLKDALVRAYGEKWYQKLKDKCESLLKVTNEVEM